MQDIMNVKSKSSCIVPIQIIVMQKSHIPQRRHPTTIPTASLPPCHPVTTWQMTCPPINPVPTIPPDLPRKSDRSDNKAQCDSDKPQSSVIPASQSSDQPPKIFQYMYNIAFEKPRCERSWLERQSGDVPGSPVRATSYVLRPNGVGVSRQVWRHNGRSDDGVSHQ